MLYCRIFLSPDSVMLLPEWDYSNRIPGSERLGVFQKSKSGFQAVARPIEMFLSEQHSDSDVLASRPCAGVCEGSLAVSVDGFNPTLAVAVDGVCQMLV
nr:DNA repair protein like [Ipomoea batatas]